MIRPVIVCTLLLALLPLSFVLAAPIVHLDPPTPILGKPLSIIISLDDEETMLSGLPDLGPFEPLAPPLQHGQEIRIVVLPMRPGIREIPPFPLQVGTARQIETAALRVTVLEGIAHDAAIAPLKRRPIPLVGSGPGGWILAAGILLLIIGVSAALLWRWWWQRPNFFKLPPPMQLVQLAAGAHKLPPSPERSRLCTEIEERRFASIVTSADDISRLRSQLLALMPKERR